ncbi:unnamed protein product [Kluyveromyces dobzhanskii CBS 2104]|uniref:WGS project CCBQ000000000 data, contig 00041 n=1 Tax=Kluyveromyces dobzhanskii CBS 2104 TaxID=1427455 RepID=A0A0A8L2L4_9SACH|nr:unnamed protein product [Kluyveromyces dobzhanskii CBS 2104]
MGSTLYLSNLPSRPDSFSKFKHLLLSTINPAHRSVSNDVDTKFVINANEDNSVNSEAPRLLDEKYQIIGISKYGSMPLQKSCFITFKDSSSCNTFLEEFQGKFKVNGRSVNIELAKKDSFAAMYHQGKHAELKNELESRKLKDVDDIPVNKKKDKTAVLKRRLRRARSKLRRKNLDEETIQKLLSKSQILSGKVKKNTAEKPEANETSMKKKVVEIVGNPPHHILLVQNLPQDVTLPELENIFIADGFKEVRLVSVRNLCFVEYHSTQNAVKVVENLGHDFSFKNSSIKIGYAKK